MCRHNGSAVAVTRQGCDRSPLAFSDTIWLDPAQIGEELPAMLPGMVESVTPEQFADVDRLIAHNEDLRVQKMASVQ